MHGKEFLADCIRTFFTIVAMINIAMFLMGVTMMPDKKFGYEGFIIPVIYGLAGTLPNLVLYSKRELKVGELILRKIIQFLLTEACVLFAIFFDSAEADRSPWLIGVVALSILVIFVLATLSDWLQNYLSAKQMTEDLKTFQGKFQE
ncbi:MAG: hypothetical protein J6K15_01060 [Lachnospiraceae bacterium]|nr:hypothetical protein [Lachnospiraceae bacterium]